jgi:hypothetical protein
MGKDAPFASPADDAFFGSVGRVVVSWAQLELGLDFSIRTIRLHLGGKDIAPEPPRSLQQKLRFLRRAAVELPALSGLRDQILSMVPLIEVEAEHRHDLIHGVAFHHLSGESEAAMVRLLRQTQGPPVKAFLATTVSILRQAIRTSKLAGQTLALGHTLAASASRT